MNESAPHTPKKVLFVVTKGNFGGAQRYVFDLAIRLPAPYQPVVASGVEQGDTLLRMLEESGVRTSTLAALSRDVGIRKEWRAFKELYLLFKKERPAVVHLNSPKAGGLGALAARMARVPRIIYTAHGWPFWEPRPWYQRVLIYFFSWLTLMLCHKTICISQADMRAVRMLPFASLRTTLIYNGIEKPAQLPREAARTALYDAAILEAHKDDFWVATIAEHTANKNLDFALAAIAAYNTTHERRIFYSLIGTGELEGALKEAARKTLPNHAHFAGFVADAARYLPAYDALFLPSLKEGVPYVILEAQCAGIPVVASRAGGIPEIATSQDTLINPRNTTSAIQGLERAACTPPTENRCVHTLEKMLAETLQVY